MEKNNEDMLKLNIANKFKENCRILFSQLKSGCQRKFCYNTHCAKNRSTNIYGGDKEILSDAIKLAKLSECEELICKKVNSSQINQIPVEDFYPLFDKEDNYLNKEFNNFYENILQENAQFPSANLDFEKLRMLHTRNDDFTAQLNTLNNFFSDFANIEKSFSEISEKRHIYYFILYSKYLIFITLSPNFLYSTYISHDYYDFFKKYLILRKNVKNILKSKKKDKNKYLELFKGFQLDPAVFSQLINNYQNFLALMIYQTGDDEEEGPNQDMFQVLVVFMKIFKILYQINESYKIVSYKEFYNGGVSNDLNLKIECKTYLKVLNKAPDSEDLFCLIKYHWLFDAAAKSEILYIFNYQKQRSEIFNMMMNQLNQISLSSVFLVLEVRREFLLEDAMDKISDSQLNFKKQLKVKFKGEQGVDEGGVKKEFFLLLVKHLFDIHYNMFTYDEKLRFFWFNPYSFEPKIKFELIGVILGLAFFNNVILDIKFPSVIYKKLLNIECSIEDLKEIDQDLYKNFKFLLETKETGLRDKLMVNFIAVVDTFGHKEFIPLKEGGEDILVDETNREEYVRLYLDWYFNKHIENVFDYFKKGFYRVCDTKLFHMLRPEELELIICGTQLLDFHELEKSSRYDDGYTKDSDTIKHLWEVIHSLPLEDQKKFLFFLTGCDRAPINGLGSLIITISRFGPDSDKLPCAHTCFNHLLLPDYQNIDKLKDRLIIAINNAEGFGLI